MNFKKWHRVYTTQWPPPTFFYIVRYSPYEVKKHLISLSPNVPSFPPWMLQGETYIFIAIQDALSLSLTTQ